MTHKRLAGRWLLRAKEGVGRHHTPTSDKTPGTRVPQPLHTPGRNRHQCVSGHHCSGTRSEMDSGEDGGRGGFGLPNHKPGPPLAPMDSTPRFHQVHLPLGSGWVEQRWPSPHNTQHGLGFWWTLGPCLPLTFQPQRTCWVVWPHGSAELVPGHP